MQNTRLQDRPSFSSGVPPVPTTEHPRRRLIPIVLLALLLQVSAFAQAGRAPVDARYAPLPSYSLICYPTDRLKTAVTDRGELAYDFGPGPYAQPLTRIGFSLRGDSMIVQRQWLDDARVPVVRTRSAGRTGSVATRAFAYGGAERMPAGKSSAEYRRIGGLNGCVAWADPPPGTPTQFRNVAWGTNRPILYRVKVPAGGAKRLALGFCESYKRTSKSRVLEIRVEGAPPQTVDPLPNGVRNEPLVVLADGVDANRDGELAVEVHPAPGGVDPNVILNGVWVFPAGSAVTAKDILNEGAGRQAELIIPCGEEMEHRGPVTRLDVLSASVEGDQARPVLEIRSRRILRSDSLSGIIQGDPRMFLRTVPAPALTRRVAGGLDVEFPAGVKRVDLYVGFGDRLPATLPSVSAAEQTLSRWWIDSAGIPSGRIHVPDPSLQYLLDAGLRTVYQVCDSVDGFLQFQPGPSVYRGLWVGDIGVPWVTALLLGDTTGTRDYIEAVLRHQGENGQVRVMAPVPSLLETPLLVFGIVEFARATGDLAWLERRFPAVAAAVDWIRRTRESSMNDPRMPYAGLFPPGFVDGGISTPATDYGTVLWAMIGLEQAIDAAQLLNRPGESARWSELLKEFITSLHAAIRRDARPDSAGGLYLPVTVGNTVPAPPQQGMASQVFPAPFGALYERDTLLQATLRGCLHCLDQRQEQGVPVGTGWLADGLWPSWFGSCAAIVQALYGDPERSHQLLYAIANHATGAGSWAEEQLPRRMGPGTGGDMANAQSAAAFVLGARMWIARERSNDLEIFPTLPLGWIVSGAAIALDRNNGRFGPFSVRCEVDSSGTRARIRVSAPPGRASRGNVLLMYDAFRRAGFAGGQGEPLPRSQVLPWGTTTVLDLRRGK